MERGNLLQPYMKNYQIFDCPSDPANDQARETDDVTNMGLPPGNTPQQKLFYLAVKDDFGYNWQYLCPLVVDSSCPQIGDGQVCDKPVQIANIAAPAHMILGVDSLWDRHPDGSVVVAGGNDAVDPPCRIEADGSDSFPYQGNVEGFFWYGAWVPSMPLAWNVFGGAWPWHGDIVNTAFVDGHAKPFRVTQLTAGCNVQDYWGGVIYDDTQYLWSGRK